MRQATAATGLMPLPSEMDQTHDIGHGDERDEGHGIPTPSIMHLAWIQIRGAGAIGGPEEQADEGEADKGQVGQAMKWMMRGSQSKRCNKKQMPKIGQ